MAIPPGTNNMHNLTTLIKRYCDTSYTRVQKLSNPLRVSRQLDHTPISKTRWLEAATSRLEDIASSTVELPKVDGLPVISTTSPLSPPTAQASQIDECVPGDLPESVEGFDAFISGPVQNFVNISNKLGGPIAEQASSLLKAFSGQRKFIFITTKAKKPDMSSATFMQLLKPLQDSITAISEIRDSNRGSLAFNQLSAVSESIGVLAWITVEPKPHKHIMEYLGSAQYWGNRVLKDYKDTDPKQVEWIHSYYKVFNDLAEYVKQTFPSGILWNSSGISAEEAIKVVEKSTPLSFSNQPKAPCAPPPPPPGPPPYIHLDESKQTNSANGIGAVFSEINKGADITKGLKKITSDQMTHKNPALRAGATVSARSDSNTSASSINPSKSPIPGKKPKPESMRTKKPSVKKLEGNKWFIENFENEPQPVKIEASISQSIIISRCSKTTIIVHGKANAISIDNSPKLSLIVDSLVSSVDIIKSSCFAMQVLGTLPTILMDSVDGAQVYLGKDSLGTEIFSSKSTGINLNILDASRDDDDYKEIPLPEQIRTWIDGGKVVNEIVEHAG